MINCDYIDNLLDATVACYEYYIERRTESARELWFAVRDLFKLEHSRG